MTANTGKERELGFAPMDLPDDLFAPLSGADLVGWTATGPEVPSDSRPSAD